MFIASAAFGGELLRYPNNAITVYTNIIVSTNSFAITNGSGAITQTNTIYTPQAVYHTFQFFYVASGTNSMVQNLDSTIDQVNWAGELTNTLAASATTNFQAITFTVTGKRTAFRLRSTYVNTNGSFTAVHMGQ